MHYTDLIKQFQIMFEEEWGYVLGTAGEKWTAEKAKQKGGEKWIGHMVADCSGAVVYAMKKGGLSVYHGSNRIARKYVETLLDLSEMEPGMIVFKSRLPGTEHYNLPVEYRKGGQYYNGDLKDYYHCGIVNTDYSIINLQSSSTGCVKSTTNGWDKCAKLKKVDYTAKSNTIQIDKELARELYEELRRIFNEE